MDLSRALVRVPASTSNLGPGFDCLGLALSLYNTVELRRTDEGTAHRGMIAETAAAFFKHRAGSGIKSFDFAVDISGAVPVSRGLGSSVTVRLGILMGLAELTKEVAPLSPNEILQLLINLEGHPDNAVASFLGGFAVCAPGSRPDSGVSYTRTPVGPQLSFVALIPELRLTTEKARGLLPKEVPLKLAVENSQRTARITSLFCTGEYAELRGLFVDHFHQPFRRCLIPGFTEILAAALQAGALGSFLSGAGSTLMAITLENPEEISRAMATAAKQHHLPASVLILKADNEGAQILR